MYGFVTHTWNPIKGICPIGCSYCYMKKWWPRMKPPRIVENELKTDLGEGKKIFVGSGIDMFANEIPGEWIDRVLEHCKKYPENEYFFQSKNPERFSCEHEFPKNTILCSTIETNRTFYNITDDKYDKYDRYEWIRHITEYKKMITIEPIIDFDTNIFIEWIKLINPVQVNIGADSGRNNLQEPSKEKIFELMASLKEAGITVHKKPNLKRLLK